MRIYTKIYSIIAVALGVLNACSLIHDDPEDCQLYTSEGVPYAYVAVAFNTGMNTSTRADENDLEDPTGGESGDGEEPGQSNENQVNDITLFFYETSETSGLNPTQQNPGVNMDPTTPIVARHHFKNGEFTYNGGTNAQTNPVEVTDLLVNHSYHVLAVVNGGDFLVDKPIENLTLGDLQQAVVQKIYDYDAPSSTSGSNPTQEGYTNFLMASADDEKPSLVILPSNSENRPAQTVIDVERVSARVDYRASGDNGSGVYDVKPSDDATSIGQAKITGAMLMNVLNADAKSWLLKRVADSWGSSEVEYLGRETYVNNAGSIAANYVIDAISSKTKDDFVTATYFKNFSYENLAWESQFKDPFFTLEDGYNCIGYPKENVNQLGDKGLTTGVVFRAQCTPDGMDKEQTFFEYNGKVYATLEALMGNAYPTSWKIINSNWASSITTWEDLRNIIITKLEDDPVGYRAYLREISNTQTGTIVDDVLTSLSWTYYLKTKCYYEVRDDGIAMVDVGLPEAQYGTTRRIFHDISGLATYKDGICYYTYWIKHANDQKEDNDLEGKKDETGGVMEYAIVRNNVYKLNVTSISGPGGDIPGDRNVNVNVLVEDWELMDEEPVDLEPEHPKTEEEN